MGELIMLLFHARTTAHVLHLKTKSFAQHKALNEFYDDIVDLADTLAETYQGEYGLIESFPAHYRPYAEPLEFISALRGRVMELRKTELSKADTQLQNIIDEIIGLIDRTNYKLKTLR
jgi:RNAse (barnase) inhibitor barstar